MRNKSNENNKSFDIKKDDAAIKGYTDPKRAQRDHQVRLLRAGLGIVVVLALIGASIYGIMQIKPRETTEQKQERIEFEQAIKTKSEVNDLNKEANTGDVTTSIEKYDDAVASANSASDKSILQLNKSIVLFNDKRIDASLESANAAYGSEKNYATTKWLATVHEEKGNRTEAIDFYKLALTLVPDNANTAVNQQQIEAKLKELRASS